MCRLDGDVDCKARGVHYKISCEGVDDKGEQCSDVNYEGETSRSTGERFPEHMHLLASKKEQVRQRSILYDHMWESHNGEIPPLKFEILGKFPGDPALRQATEDVSMKHWKRLTCSFLLARRCICSGKRFPVLRDVSPS